MCKRIFQTRWLVGCLLLCNLLLGCHDMLTCSGFFLIHTDSENKVNNGMADVNFCFHQFYESFITVNCCLFLQFITCTHLYCCKITNNNRSRSLIVLFLINSIFTLVKFMETESSIL